ncbi:hypothetical protein AUK04_00525 [Candidatus Roizmanbacteria bacterium CG2_30_33_16]|uniref:Nudix hydrolase domain-containing protein n=5 Tax=Candidatus Roizmaniibacteriota TaxID=1752723 RepID=A0A2M7E3D7_9BACT|nr:NUDIX domain-containing protein [Candidatus Roizmanbacteria bacterium]OIP86446.1 MAG: hypothetical protein AUK04_00525 [Candidatus Roizmanbacteria bacterium CG2_30_33_16]PIV62235.1 MAG: hypothetical protein COS12_03140 [Candidatus Roizmanbacteria bacterium CG01_land_8_20_14_3_00_33_9]PJB87513.1 MAG: hypothetical protein CO083_06655 [Candidatus Roizmanbacteria bacterium CG_4_9_14_0_8_um_filter_34_12]
MKPDELFCVGQKAVILKNNEVLILHDPVPPPGVIDLPGGKIQTGERDFIKSLQREVFEETNLKIKVDRPFFTSFWEFSKGSNHRNKGKKIFLLFYYCTYISGEVKISSEHDWFKWVNKKNYMSSFINKNNIFYALTEYFKIVKT